MLTSVYDTHKKKKMNNNDKRVINIAQLHLLAVLIKTNCQKHYYNLSPHGQIHQTTTRIN